MKYLPKSRLRRPNSRKAVILLILFVVLAGLFSFLDTAIVSALSPIWKAENFVSRSVRISMESWRSKQALIRENASLEERITSLELEAATLALSLEREEALFALLGRETQRQGVIAAVLTRPPQSPYDLIVIDAGARDTIALGATVSLPEGPILGVVSDLFETSAKVKLFTTAGEKTEAVLERHNIPVMLEGRGGGNFRIIVSRETEVQVGDRIISPDLSYSLMAVVEEIEVEATDSFKEVLAKSPANIFTVRLVSVTP